MGVPYKLDIEIVKFIIDQKQANPKLGCRSFVDLIRAKFDLTVSKSTVNSVVKEAGLSKRVGRPATRPSRLITAPKPKTPKIEKQPVRPKETYRALPKQIIAFPIKKKEEQLIPPKPKPKTEIPKEVPAPKEQKPIILPEKIEPVKKPEIPKEIKVEKQKKEIKPEPPKPETPRPIPKLESPKKEEPKEIPKPSAKPKPETPEKEKPKEIPKPSPKPEPKKPKEEKPKEPPKKEPPKKEEPEKLLPEESIPEPAKVREIKKEDPLREIEKFLQPVDIKEDEVFDSMGAFFLKAAELEISKTSILGNIAREVIPKIDILGSEIKSNMLLYLPAFGIENVEALSSYDMQGLRIFSNSLASQDYAQAVSFLQDFKMKEQISARLYDECDKNFKEVNHFKFILKDGTIFYVDARLKSIWQETNIPDNFSVCLNKAKSYIEERFIQIFSKDIQPILLFNVPSFRSFSPMVSEFIQAFEDIPEKRIKEIGVFASGNRELEDYRNIVPAKRAFVFGFWPWQQQTKEFLKAGVGVVRDLYFPELARKIYYAESSVEFPKDSEINLKLIFLKNSAFSSPRMGLLTNIQDQSMETEDVIKLYLNRWPNFEDTFQDLMSSSERLTYRGFVYPVFDEEKEPKKEKLYIQPESPNQLDECLKALFVNLSTASQRHFFPYGYKFADVSTMRERFYSLPGKLKRKDKNFYISLLPPKDYPYSNDLFYAVRRINESDIRDIFGCKIWFKVL